VTIRVNPWLKRDDYEDVFPCGIMPIMIELHALQHFSVLTGDKAKYITCSIRGKK
jgi:hypothetical protein